MGLIPVSVPAGGIIIAPAVFVYITIHPAIQVVIPAETAPAILNAERINIIVPRTAAIPARMNVLILVR